MDLLNTGILTIVRLFIWILLILFVVFSVIVLRQVQLMTRVLIVSISGGFKFVAVGLLLYAAIVFLVSLVIL